MDIVDEIECASYSKAIKIERLWAVAMLNYRQPLGDKAWGLMRNLTDSDTTQAIAFLTGFATGGYQEERLKEIAGII